MRKSWTKMLGMLLALIMIVSCMPVLAEDTKSELWLTDEKITFTFWYPLNAGTFLSDACKNYGEADVFKWLEEQTNVHIEFIHPANGTEKESFNLLFADERLPDFVYNDRNYYYADGPDAAVEDGYYLRLNELQEQYAPNYMAVLNNDETIAKNTATDTGLRWNFNFIYGGENGRLCNFGPAIRKDFLEKFGLETPVTYDDWHNVLTAFKENGIEYPLLLNYAGSCSDDGWMAGYNVKRGFFHNGEDEVKYGPIEDGYGEYVNMMAQWYAEGLIYPDFALQSNADEPEDNLVLNDRIGAWATFASWAGKTYYPSSGAVNPDFNLMGVTHPVVNEGDETHIRTKDTKVTVNRVAISADCEYPEIAVKWLDIFYNMDYVNIFNYGLREGESYYVDETGYHWGELITNNQEGLTRSQARLKYTMMNAPLEYYTRVSDAWEPEVLESQQEWVKGKDDWTMPDSMTLTADENRRVTTIMADIDTFVLEETCKMIMGTSTYTFETFREQIIKMGVENAIAIEQAGYDRYLAR